MNEVLTMKEVPDVKRFTVLSVNKGGVHLAWWIFWLLVCMPVLIILAIVEVASRETQNIKVEFHNGDIKVYENVRPEVIKALYASTEF